MSAPVTQEWLANYSVLLLRLALASHPKISRDYATAVAQSNPVADEMLEEHQRYTELYAAAAGLSPQQAKEQLDEHADLLHGARRKAETVWTVLAIRSESLSDMALQAEGSPWLHAYSLAAAVSQARLLFELEKLARTGQG